jgi:hypothetical protein
MVRLLWESKLHATTLYQRAEKPIAYSRWISLEQAPNLIKSQLTHGTQLNQQILHHFWRQSTLGSGIFGNFQKNGVELLTE